MKKEEIKLVDEETIVNDTENTKSGIKTTGMVKSKPKYERGEENSTRGKDAEGGEDDGTDGEGRPNKGKGPGSL